MSVSREQVVAYLSALSPGELHELILALEDVWSLEPVEGPTRVDITIHGTMGMPIMPGLVLREAGSQRIQVMKLVRRVMGCGLREARDIIENTPVRLLEEIERHEFAELLGEFQAIGAVVEWE